MIPQYDRTEIIKYVLLKHVNNKIGDSLIKQDKNNQVYAVEAMPNESKQLHNSLRCVTIKVT